MTADEVVQKVREIIEAGPVDSEGMDRITDLIEDLAAENYERGRSDEQMNWSDGW